MMKFKSKLCFFTIIILFQYACSVPRHYLDGTVKGLEFIKGEKAIVLMKIFNTEESRLFKLKGDDHCPFPNSRAINMHFSLARIDEKYPDKECRHSYHSQPQSKYNIPILDIIDPLKVEPYEVFMIEPGTYVLEDLAAYLFDSQSTIYSQRDGIQNIENANVALWGIFNVKPGEILYVGDVYFSLEKIHDTGNLNNNIAVLNRYEEAVNYFKNKYPELSNKPIKAYPLRIGEI